MGSHLILLTVGLLISVAATANVENMTSTEPTFGEALNTTSNIPRSYNMSTSQETNITATPEVNTFNTILTSNTAYKVGMFIHLYKYAILCPISVIGNTLSFMALYNRAKKVSSYVFMSVLAVADMFFVLCGTVSISYIRSRPRLTTLSCQFISVLLDGSAVYAVWLVVAMSVERLLVIWFPLKLRDWCTVRKARLTCAGVLLAVFALTGHYWWSMIAVESSISKDVWFCAMRPESLEFKSHWGIMYPAFYSWVPLLCLVSLNIGLVVGMVRITRQRAKLKTSETKNDQLLRVTKMAATISITFVLLTSPFAILRLIVNGRLWNYQADPYSNATYIFLDNLFLFLVNINHCVNVFLYFLSGRAFRQDLYRVVTCGRYRPTDATSMAKTASTGVPSVSQDVTSRI